MFTPEQLLQKINHCIDNLPYDRRPATLYDPIKYVLSIGGKRLRPVLMMLAYNMYKDDPESILWQALGIETYHNYTLLHDDLMDQADLRRGHATVHRKWNANTAILSGDSMLVLAYQYMAKCDDRHLPEILNLFTQTALEIGEGQQYDMDFEQTDNVGEEQYIEMIRLKTSVLLACALKIGAIMADAPKQDADNIYRFGEKLGLAFQLQDDLLDVYGDTKVFGKAIGGDITSNKKTFMLINAINHADTKLKAELCRWIEATTFVREEKVEAVTRIYNEIGIKQMCQEKINSYFMQAKSYLEKVELPADRKAMMQQYMANMMNREY